mgnify:FL=1
MGTTNSYSVIITKYRDPGLANYECEVVFWGVYRTIITYLKANDIAMDFAPIGVTCPIYTYAANRLLYP